MDTARLEKLRRFALTAGLLLLTYVAAGITVEPHVSAYGLSVSIGNPRLLPIGLACASLWGMARFAYYGIMLASSPYRARRDLIDALTVAFGENPKPGAAISGRRVWMYHGHRRFQTSPWHGNYDLIQKQAAEIGALFPKFARARVSTEILRDFAGDEQANEYPIFALGVVIPLRCRIAGFFQDFDYTLPLTLNALALTLFAWRMIGQWIFG